VKEIVREEGVWRDGLVTKGITASMLRDGTWNAFYFGIYHGSKVYLPKLEDDRADFLRRFLMGLAAGSIASLANIPFDVAKSRIQGPTPEDGKPYQGTIRTIIRVSKLLLLQFRYFTHCKLQMIFCVHPFFHVYLVLPLHLRLIQE